MDSLVETGIFAEAGRAGWRAVLLLLQAIPDPAWIKDANGRYVAVNPPYLLDFRERNLRDAVQVIGMRARDVHDPADAERIETEDRELLQRGGQVRDERWMVDRSGRRRGFEITRFVVLDDHGTPVGTMGIARDISERVALTEGLRASEAQLAALIRNLPGTLFRRPVDQPWAVDFVSDGVLELSGHPPETFLRGERRWIDLVHDDDREELIAVASRGLEALGSYALEYRIVRADGRLRRVSERGLRMDQASGGGMIEAYVSDITESHERLQRLAYLASHDELTGLANRNGLLERTSQSLAAAGDAEPVALAVVNLDHFRLVNESLGHRGGDRLLRELAGRLRNAMRPKEFAARIGDDTFAVVLHGQRGQALRARIAGLLDAVRRPATVAGGEISVTACAGYTLANGEASPDVLLRQADAALVRARRLGRDRFTAYDPGSDEGAELRVRLATDLRRALERDELAVHYQPIHTREGSRPFALEALLRWQHPELGMVGPSTFVPLAEETGQIVEIGAWVLEQACRELVALRGEGHAIDHVSVNLSVVQLRDEGLPRQVHEILQRTGLAPNRLALEVTESCAVFDTDEVMQRLASLKAMGLLLVMDDFGTGYSSLAQLRRFPLDRLKLDRQFVTELEQDPVARRICEVVTTLAHGLGMTVVAEGVETQAQLDLLGKIGCDLVQGFLLARPMPPAALRSHLAEVASGAG
ncbi:MAG: EAL domain-containing protein [Xanthomonadales bacterium]|nr:EAL domain-containing protein [Xanthomonadales bacterium]